MTTKRYSLSPLSIRQRLPLFICFLLVGIIAILSIISYIGVKRTAMAVGKERLESLTEQVSSLFANSIKGLVQPVRLAAGQPAIKQYLSSGGKDSASSATATLEKLKQDTLVVLSEIVNMQHRSVLRSETAKGVGIEVNIDSLLPEIQKLQPDSGKVGKIYTSNNRVYFTTIVSITDSSKKTIGYLVRLRAPNATSQAVEQLAKLLGANARLYIGNDDGKLWTDMIRPVEGPSDAWKGMHGVMNYSRGKNDPVIATIRPMNNSHLLVLIELSQQNILESSQRFLYWLIIAGVILLGVGIFIAWLMSRNITTPLHQLTAATSGIAGGHFSAPLQVSRLDELGKLARTFNAMSVQVKKSQEELQKKMHNYKLLFEDNPMPMWIMRKNGFMMMDVNKAAIKHYGYTREEFLNLHAKDLRPDSEIEKFMEHMNNVSIGMGGAGVWKHKKKDGTVIMVEIMADDIIYDDQPSRIVLANDVTEKLKAEAELSRQMVLQQKLITETTIQAQEKEREEIGKDLHDNINQILAATKLYLEMALSGKKEFVSEALVKSHDNVNLAITEIRQLSKQLVPPTLDDTFKETLAEFVKEIQQASGINITANSKTFEESLIDGSLKLMLYRIIQEQVNNILKHARAKNVSIEIGTGNETVFLIISDDGIGFDTTKKAKGIGLRNISSRVGFYNGITRIMSTPGMGCTLEVSVPLKQEVPPLV